MKKYLRATLDELKVEVGEVVERWYHQGYKDGYIAGSNEAKAELTDKKSNPNELEWLLKDWSEKQE
jgi:hypothetical protein